MALEDYLVGQGKCGHAFFNDTGERYNPTAAAEARTALLAWLGKHL